MQISPNSLSNKTRAAIDKNFSRVLTEIKTPAEASQFVADFFTQTEQTVLMKRLAIAVMLRAEKSYEEIKKQLNVSSATISTVAEMMKKPGVELALQKIQEDAWAENFLAKLPFLKK